MGKIAQETYGTGSSGLFFRREIDCDGIRIVYARVRAIAPEDNLATHPSAVDFSFLGHDRTFLKRGGVDISGRIRPLTAAIRPKDEIQFVALPTPSKYLEVQTVVPSAAPEARSGLTSPKIVALALRLRLALVGQTTSRSYLADLGLAFERAVRGHTQSPDPERVKGGLDARRLARVVDYIHAETETGNKARALPLTELAGIACLSAFHFQKAFKRSLGMSPHAFVEALRMQRARDALMEGRNLTHAAAIAGYAPGHRFRNTLHRYILLNRP